MLENITSILRSIEGRGTFASRETSEPEDLRLEVKGVGTIRLPVSPTMARKLCRIARPARFGSREQTLMDKGGGSQGRLLQVFVGREIDGERKPSEGWIKDLYALLGLICHRLSTESGDVLVTWSRVKASMSREDE